MKFKAAEEKIDKEYEKVNRNNIAAIKEALAKKITAINDLESSKYKYGRSENLENYLMWRHCLLYKEVAKEVEKILKDWKNKWIVLLKWSQNTIFLEEATKLLLAHKEDEKFLTRQSTWWLKKKEVL